MTRLFKKNVESCWECPGRDKMGTQFKDLDTNPQPTEGFCELYEQTIPEKSLNPRTRFNVFPSFCKLKQVYR